METITLRDLLHHREAQMISKDTLQIWMKGILGFLEIKEKQVPLKPLNESLNEKEIFAEANPQVNYHAKLFISPALSNNFSYQIVPC
ncbi:hypothetical protein CHS0354_029178 [Potamilus streckersoni]|uniref:Uncharacterized protein n=1 Tax=Potamilus streckersoni TaxID=2493646 RepID=A0AAE0RU78_9BIVA|nr:hypothetical protein CHS0354_029178 [Potamilus streckersoni]